MGMRQSTASGTGPLDRTSRKHGALEQVKSVPTDITTPVTRVVIEVRAATGNL